MLNQDSSSWSLWLLETGSSSSVSEARLSAWLAFKRWSENCANASMATISICLLASILLSISGPKADCINEIVSSLLIEGNGSLIVSMSSFTLLLSSGDVSLSEIDTREVQNNEGSIRLHIYTQGTNIFKSYQYLPFIQFLVINPGSNDSDLIFWRRGGRPFARIESTNWECSVSIYLMASCKILAYNIEKEFDW